MKETFDPSRIRKCEVVEKDGESFVQFIAIGDKHQMMKMDDGSVQIIKLPEQGKDYRYKDPFPLQEALEILQQGHHETHAYMADQIKQRMTA